MFDKQMENKLKNALNNIDPKKLEQVKKTLSSRGNIDSLLKNVDSAKAQKKLSELNLGNIDFNSLVSELKNNPNALNDLKKNL